MYSYSYGVINHHDTHQHKVYYFRAASPSCSLNWDLLKAFMPHGQGMKRADTALSARDVEILPIFTEEKKK